MGAGRHFIAVEDGGRFTVEVGQTDVHFLSLIGVEVESDLVRNRIFEHLQACIQRIGFVDAGGELGNNLRGVVNEIASHITIAVGGITGGVERYIAGSGSGCSSRRKSAVKSKRWTEPSPSAEGRCSSTVEQLICNQ